MTHQPHITGYEILSDSQSGRLSAKVMAAIHDGWQPFGPLAISPVATHPDNLPVTYSQAMVKQSEWYR